MRCRIQLIVWFSPLPVAVVYLVYEPCTSLIMHINKSGNSAHLECGCVLHLWLGPFWPRHEWMGSGSWVVYLLALHLRQHGRCHLCRRHLRHLSLRIVLCRWRVLNNYLYYFYHQQDRAGIIGVVQIATVILGLMQFVGSTLILIYGVEESSTLVSELQDVFLKLVYEYDNDKNARALLQQIMEYVSGSGGMIKMFWLKFTFEHV